MFPPGVVPPGVHPSPDGADVATPVSLAEWFVNFYPECAEMKVRWGRHAPTNLLRNNYAAKRHAPAHMLPLLLASWVTPLLHILCILITVVLRYLIQTMSHRAGEAGGVCGSARRAAVRAARLVALRSQPDGQLRHHPELRVGGERLTLGLHGAAGEGRGWRVLSDVWKHGAVVCGVVPG